MNQSDAMKSNVLLPSLILLLCAGGCCSSPGPTTTQLQHPRADLLKIAETEFRQGRLADAEKHLQLVLKADPKNNEAWYYLDSVEQRRKQTKADLERLSRERDGVWYPTLPQRKLSDETAA